MFFEKLEQTLTPFDPLVHSVAHHQAAVLVMITDEAHPHIIYAKRAAHLKHHAGEICFPGGMLEAQDANLIHTALRETQEELNIGVSQQQILGVLPSRTTRNETQVLPVVARVAVDINPVPNLLELSEVFRFSLSQIKSSQIRTDHFSRQGVQISIPVYQHLAHEIWGFTALVTQDLLKILELD